MGLKSLSRLSLLILCLSLFMAAAGLANKKEKEQVPSDASGQIPEIFGKTEIKMEAATVEAIDMEKRLVTLKMLTGEVKSIVADERVKNLAQVKVGDKVVFKYFEALEIRVMGKDEAEIPVGTNKSLISAPLGQKPAGISTSQKRTMATIIGINKESMKATLKWAEGDMEVIDVKEPEYFDKVKVGDRIEIIHTNSTAVQVTGEENKK